MSAKKQWGFNVRNIDHSVRPQDDFYHYANGGWLKKTKIPADESRWGSFIILRHKTDKQLHVILNSLLKRKKYPTGSPEQMVSDLYRSGMDMHRRNVLGVKPLERDQELIQGINTPQELLSAIATLHRTGTSTAWHDFVDQDSKDSTRYRLHLYQGGLGMPDRDYYLKNEPEQKRVRSAYIEHIRKLLKLSGIKEKAIAQQIKIIIEIETELAKASMPKEDARDPEKTYHKKSLQQLKREVPQIDWKKYFTFLGAKKIDWVIVAQPDFFKEAGRLIEKRPLEEWKIYLAWNLLNGSASALSEPFIKENFHFYSTVLMGTKKMRPLWRRSLNTVNGTIGELLGKLYIQKHFTRSSKQAMNRLVDDLFAVYESRIKNLDWMSAITKRKAIAKLHLMSRKIGYPNKWKSYRGLRIRPNDYFGNLTRIAEYEIRRHLGRLHKPVDRDEWFIPPQVVNAFYNSNLNDILFPAAILQSPYFDLHNDDAVNYAAIGSVIGHEITHGFDDHGSKFDGKGNLRNWWTPQDQKRFERKTKLLIDQFNAYEVMPGIKANGRLTLGENIADLGGMVIAFDAYQRHLKKTGRKDINGLSPEKRFFFAFAQAERELARDEFVKTVSLIDPHAHHTLRVNGPVSNAKEFYEVFNIRPTDKLYRPPQKRAKIW